MSFGQIENGAGGDSGFDRSTIAFADNGWDLLPWDAVEQVVLGLNCGARKYNARNWDEGLPFSRVFAAAVRHLWVLFYAKVTGGDGTDPESALSHLALVGCRVPFVLAFAVRRTAVPFEARKAAWCVYSGPC
jgi:hypothetical protein